LGISLAFVVFALPGFLFLLEGIVRRGQPISTGPALR
jgi:hypothetical protein